MGTPCILDYNLPGSWPADTIGRPLVNISHGALDSQGATVGPGVTSEGLEEHAGQKPQNRGGWARIRFAFNNCANTIAQIGQQ